MFHQQKSLTENLSYQPSPQVMEKVNSWMAEEKRERRRRWERSLLYRLLKIVRRGG